MLRHICQQLLDPPCPHSPKNEIGRTRALHEVMARD